MKGSCLCGSVKFRISGPEKFLVHCHCKMCRKAHGAGFVTWLGIKEDQLNIDAGADAIQSYESSPGAKRRFCGQCGSSMFFIAPRWPEELHVAFALIDDSTLSPTAHAYVDDKAHWTEICDGLPLYGGKTGTEPLA